MEKIKVGIIGPGNIGSDLLFKILESDILEVDMITGIEESEGIKRARKMGINTATNGVDAIVARKDIKIAFDATGSGPHIKFNAPALKKAGIKVIDLTPAAIGPYCVPSVNLDELEAEDNINMVTCGGQATIPIVYAVHRAAGAEYAEVVASIASKSAGPGTRANIDEFTVTTTRAIEEIGKADKGKTIIVLNPAEPPIMMTNTVLVKIKDKTVSEEAILKSVNDMVKDVQQYVPGYHLRIPPTLDGDKVTTIIQVRGQGHFLPEYAGNLDIITSAAVGAAEKIARNMLVKEMV